MTEKRWVEKRWVFCRWWNVDNDSTDIITSAGKAFQILGLTAEC